MSLLTTQSLLGHARSGSNSAWKVILMRYRMTLVVAASRQLGSMDDVEDVVQTAFMQAVSSLERFVYTDEGSFRRYLVQVVLNRCRDLHRKRRPESSSDLTHVPQPGSLEELSPKEQQVAVALERLPEDLREVVLLKRYESKPWREVAEVLGESDSTSRRRYVRAIDALREMLT